MVQPALETSTPCRSGLSGLLDKGGRRSKVAPVKAGLLCCVNHLTRAQTGPARECRISELRGVVLLTDMRHEQHLEPGGVRMVEKLPGLSIGQVTKIAAYPFLHSVRIRPIGQHLGVVIELQHQCIAARERLHNVRRDTAQVGEHTQLEIIMSETKLHRLPRVVGYGLGGNIDIPHRELIAGPNHYSARKLFKFRAGRGASGEEYGQIVGFGEGHHPAAVITVLVGHQNGVNVLPAHTAGLQPRLDIAPRQTTVNQ